MRVIFIGGALAAAAAYFAASGEASSEDSIRRRSSMIFPLLPPLLSRTGARGDPDARFRVCPMCFVLGPFRAQPMATCARALRKLIRVRRIFVIHPRRHASAAVNTCALTHS